MRILALDFATKTGWALYDNGTLLSGVWDFSIQRDESDGMRLWRFHRKLVEILDCTPVETLVPYEAVRADAKAGKKNQSRAIIVQGEMQGVLKNHLASLKQRGQRVEYHGYSSTEIKKHATGRGNAKKEQMVEAACDKWPDQNIVDDNQADALWILDLARKEYCSTQPQGESQ